MSRQIVKNLSLSLFIFLIVVFFLVSFNKVGATTGYSEIIYLKPGWNTVSTPRLVSSHSFSAPETSENFDIFLSKLIFWAYTILFTIEKKERKIAHTINKILPFHNLISKYLLFIGFFIFSHPQELFIRISYLIIKP